jgi:hypothetical protein
MGSRPWLLTDDPFGVVAVDLPDFGCEEQTPILKAHEMAREAIAPRARLRVLRVA